MARGSAHYNISTAARMLGISARMLREYEKDGLIKPLRNPSNRYRLFSNEDLQWIRCIRQLIHHEGLNIKGIRRLLTFMPCWELKKCPTEIRLKCKAVVDRSLPCWTEAGKHCQDADRCRACKVYLEAQKTAY